MEVEATKSQLIDDGADEISIKDLLVKAKSVITYIKKRWKLILLFSIIGAAGGIGYSFIKKPLYTATCTFVLEENGKGGGLSQYAGLASLAGIDIGGGSGGGIFQGDNILELYQSRVMIEKALLSKVNNERLIDRYIAFNKLRDKWKKDPLTASVAFEGNPATFSRTQDSIITDIVVAINKKVLQVTKPDKKLSIIKVVVQTKDELFSKLFNEQLVKEVNDFYVQTKTKKSLQSITVLQHQKDSVRSVLDKAISGTASAIDATPNANPALLTLRVPSQKKQIDVQASTAVYAEIVKNLELYTISLRQETPLIQVIDTPVLPLEKDVFGKIKGLVVGFLIGGILTIVLLFVKMLTSNREPANT